MDYLNYLRLEKEILLDNGNKVHVYLLDDSMDDNSVKEWATHFRQIYCPDEKIDRLRRGTGLSRKGYLLKRVFPDRSGGFGPATRLGDFAELIIGDYLSYLEGFYVPKDRYVAKFNRNTSTQGTDVIGLKKGMQGSSAEDEMVIVEVKAKAQNRTSINRLQEAVLDVQKNEEEKIGVTLNAIKHRALDRDDDIVANLVERFQDIVNNPYIMTFGAAAVQEEGLYEENMVKSTIAETYVKKLLFIKRKQLMQLVNKIYEKAADIDD